MSDGRSTPEEALAVVEPTPGTELIPLPLEEVKPARRVRSSIDLLPPEVREEFDLRLAANKHTFVELSEWLTEQGYSISKSAIGRYSRRSAAAAKRVADTLQRTRTIVQEIEAHPDLDYTKAAQVMLMDGLTRRVSSAEDEFDEMPLDKAGRLIASLSRNATYEKKVRQDMRKKAELAFDQLETELMAAIRQYPDLTRELRDVLSRARERVTVDD